MIYAIILFAVTYVLMIVFGKYRPWIALASGVVFIVSGMLPIGEVWGALDFNVLLMIAGTMDWCNCSSIPKCPTAWRTSSCAGCPTCAGRRWR